jgi:hypothetical protein
MTYKLLMIVILGIIAIKIGGIKDDRDRDERDNHTIKCTTFEMNCFRCTMKMCACEVSPNSSSFCVKKEVSPNYRSMCQRASSPSG